jgi:hypothetical protein
MIQLVLTILVVGGAVGYLSFEVYKHFFQKKQSCEGCSVSKSMSATTKSNR